MDISQFYQQWKKNIADKKKTEVEILDETDFLFLHFSDIKPENILINHKAQLKLCDFGMARSIATKKPSSSVFGFLTKKGDSKTNAMNSNVGTKYYRVPFPSTENIYKKTIS